MNDSFTNHYLLIEDNTHVFYQINFESNRITDEDEVYLFNYGLVCSNFQFIFQINHLQKLGKKILLHDYRGHFTSRCAHLEEITYENIANDIYKLLNHLKIKNTHVIAHSMGVSISLELYRVAAEKIRSMTLITGSPFPMNNIMFDTYLMSYLFPIFQRILKSSNILQEAWPFFVENPISTELTHFQGFNYKTVNRDFVKMYLEKVSDLGVDLFSQLYDQMNYHQINDIVNSITCPCLIIAGDKDTLVPFPYQIDLHKRIPHSDLYVVLNGSHVPQVDFPVEINEKICNFLNM